MSNKKTSDIDKILTSFLNRLVKKSRDNQNSYLTTQSKTPKIQKKRETPHLPSRTNNQKHQKLKLSNINSLKLNIMKIKLKIFAVIAILFTANIAVSQSYSNHLSKIGTIPTNDKSLKIKIKNGSEKPEVILIFKHDNNQKYWDLIGSVSVFQLSEGTFYVKEGFTYGYALEGHRPIKIGSEEQYKVRRGD